MTTKSHSARAKSLDERLERLLMRKRTLVFELWQAFTLGLAGEAGFSANRIRTETNGLFRFLPDGASMVEEHDYGRLPAIDRAGNVRWSYVNRAPKDERVYHLGWSRALLAERAAE